MRCASLLLLPLLLLAQADRLAEQSQQAKQAMAVGRFEEAAVIYRELITNLPDNPGLRLNLGLALHSSGDFAGAIRSLENAVKLDPRLAPAWLFLGLSFQKLGQPRNAIPPLEKAVALDPQNRVARLELADAYYTTKQFDRASAGFRSLVAADPASAKGWQGLGLSCLGLSRQSSQRLEEIGEKSAYWYALLGRSRMEQAQYRSAFQLYRNAIATKPDLREAHQALADIYRRTGHFDWSVIEAEKEKQLPAVNCAREPLECAYFKGELARVIAAKPETPAACYWIARAYSALADRAFSKIAELPDSAELHQLRAEDHALAGRRVEAVGEWRQAVRLAPRDARLQLSLARELVAARNYAEAQPLLEDLLRREGSAVEPNILMGRILAERQMNEQALPYLEKAAATSLEAKALTGRALLQLGRPEDAIRNLLPALPLDADGTLHYQLAVAYRRTGRVREAGEIMAKQQKIAEANAKRARMDEDITPP